MAAIGERHRQGNKVSVAYWFDAVVRFLRLLLKLRAYVYRRAEDLHVFRGLNGHLVAKNPGRTAPGPDKIAYDQMLRFMGLWFSGLWRTLVGIVQKVVCHAVRAERECFRGC
jgi:hypothetical protein